MKTRWDFMYAPEESEVSPEPAYKLPSPGEYEILYVGSTAENPFETYGSSISGSTFVAGVYSENAFSLPDPSVSFSIGSPVYIDTNGYVQKTNGNQAPVGYVISTNSSTIPPTVSVVMCSQNYIGKFNVPTETIYQQNSLKELL